MSKLVKIYLFAYNSLQAIGWSVSLFIILGNYVLRNSINGTYASAGELLCVLQTAQFVEVVHGAIGIVPSGVLSPLMQWGGRTHILLAIIGRITEVQESPSVFITVLVWSIAEVIRYPHYAFTCMGMNPSWINYLRYTMFIVLYPVGFSGEMWLMYQALPYIKNQNIYSNFFAAFPFSYYDFIRVLLLCYPFLGLKLYLHMLKQRRSKLGKQHGKRKKQCEDEKFIATVEGFSKNKEQ